MNSKPSASEMQISASEGLSVRPAMLVAVEMEKVKHSCSVSSTLSDVMDIGTHCNRALSLIWKVSFRAV